MKLSLFKELSILASIPNVSKRFIRPDNYDPNFEPVRIHHCSDHGSDPHVHVCSKPSEEDTYEQVS